MNYLQIERNYLSILQNVWVKLRSKTSLFFDLWIFQTDEILLEQNANVELIKQLNQRTVKFVTSI